MQSKESSFKTTSQFECRTTVSPMQSLLSAELFAEAKSESRIQIVSGTGAPPPTPMPLKEYWDPDWCDNTCCYPAAFPPPAMNCGGGGRQDFFDEDDDYSRGVKCMLDSQGDTIIFDPMTSIDTTTSSMTASTKTQTELGRNVYWAGNPSMFVNPPVFAMPLRMGGPIQPRSTLGLPMI
jgi:hypothetical protein